MWVTANSLLRSGLLGQTQDEAASLASQPSVPSPEVSKPLTQKHFNAIPQKTKPRALCLVFCARLCLFHTSHGAQGQGTKSSSSSMSAASMGMRRPTCTTPVAGIQASRHATTQRGSASPKSPWTEDPRCWGVKPSELGLNTPHCAASL